MNGTGCLWMSCGGVWCHSNIFEGNRNMQGAHTCILVHGFDSHNICNMLSGYEMGIAIIVTCCDSVYMHIYLIRLCTYAMWCGYNVN